MTSGVAPKTVPLDVGSLYRVSAVHEAATLLAFHVNSVRKQVVRRMQAGTKSALNTQTGWRLPDGIT